MVYLHQTQERERLFSRYSKGVGGWDYYREEVYGISTCHQNFELDKVGYGNRKPVGWCFETLTKSTFPSSNYIDFRGISEVGNLNEESTSSSGDLSAILLSG